MNSTDFSSLSLKPDLLKNLSSLGYESMTPIQALSLPIILSGEDVIGQGKTGSGKTAAFGLGLLQKLDTTSFKAQSLVLCPTRELADQVASEIRKLARAIHNIKVLTLCGGTPFGPQIGSLEHGTHIVVGTPGRIEEHLRKGTLKLDNINTLVLDEADRMLDMGFQDTIDQIIEKIPSHRQTLLFSATYPDEIASITDRVMQNPTVVEASSVDEESTIKQYFHLTNTDDERMIALRLLLVKHKPDSALVFCNTKNDTQDVADELAYYKFYAISIHGDLDQRERDQALIRFSNGSVSVLVATDVAARGLDIDDLDMVINFNIAHDPEVHTHRIGRTGRAGKHGIACTLYSDREMRKLDALEIDLAGCNDPLPNDNYLDKPLKKPTMTTLKIDGGKKQKLRPGDIVGGLTGKGGIPGDKIGKINVGSNWSYVAVSSELVKTALKKIQNDKLKGKAFRVRILS
ncbi:ATP-dependent RNA helicase DbpA [Bathymodiolus thermophilus thioautotrophic gill symbiont]|uniref:DEAD-box ATP-dependent RNA helicase RhpA n=1 Tax=Bathymodiolus thermophilus thioautotrophic gill symbiont TaxID=2360 RepID=A0A8H8XC93_9GAMM|nr:ATP-dependent RNA helicase DbpA [Bathymodiolus thermophilus thioautotrophic gill symbiont]CAB5498943.1 ATP-dependent 23S rRNA helicase DbpA [Bathymodiolus thermophilus thioautotrophic gill symbiont]